MTKPSSTPLSDHALSCWPEFVRVLTRRVAVGRDTYGDASLLRPAPELAGEIEQELLDVAGWGFLLWYRIRRLNGAFAKLESDRSLAVNERLANYAGALAARMDCAGSSESVRTAWSALRQDERDLVYRAWSRALGESAEIDIEEAA
jgi:hypothetical protein